MRRFRFALFIAPLVVFAACPSTPPPTLGAKCTTETIGRCQRLADGGVDMDPPRLLQCTGGTYVIYADCKGPGGCSESADTADCDTNGNSAGDHCAPTSEGKVRCDPDGGLNILRCVNGVLDVIFTCAPPTFCGFSDAGLTCI